jgi:Polysaccharide pyruvyl transferase
MKVLLINDSTTNTNWGDRAAAISLMAMISATGGRIIHAITEDELKSSAFGKTPSLPSGGSQDRVREIVKQCIPPILLSLRRKVLSRRDAAGAGRFIPDRWEDFEGCARAVRREQRYGWPDLLGAIDSADVAVIHGASMDGNGIIPRTDLFLTYLIKRHFRKPIIIVNHTADLDHPDLRRMAEEVYPLFDDVVFRDPISAERCESLCGGRFAADTAFWFEPAPRRDWAPIAGRPTYFDIWPHKARFDPSQPYLCLGGSSILWSGWNPRAMVRDFSALIEAIQAVYSGQVVLTASDIPEQMIFEPVATALSLPLVGVTTPVQQAVDIVGNADAYIGGRWHPGIFALRGGVPVIALSSKTFKMQSLMRSAGLPETPFDALDLADKRDSLIHMLQQHLEGGSELRNRLRTWAAKEAEKSWDNVTYLRQHQRDWGAAESRRRAPTRPETP